MDENKCGFCHTGDETVDICGTLHKDTMDGKVIAAHHKCMQYSACLVQYKSDSFGGFKKHQVYDEIRRGSRLICTLCKNDKKKKNKKGATSGCALKNCRKTFHYYCVSMNPDAVSKRYRVAAGQKVVILYRVFCSQKHEELYRINLKAEDVIGGQEDSSSDSEQEDNESHENQSRSSCNTDTDVEPAYKRAKTDFKEDTDVVDEGIEQGKDAASPMSVSEVHHQVQMEYSALLEKHIISKSKSTDGGHRNGAARAEEELGMVTDVSSHSESEGSAAGRSDLSKAKCRKMNQKMTYHDWVKSTLSLLYVKEAIADTVNKNAIQLHQIIRSKVEKTCKSAVQQVCKDCTSNDVRVGDQLQHRSSVYYINCKTNVCNHWLDAILNHHADLPKPLVVWGNINPTVWPKEPWEIAKVFMPIGCEKQRQAKDSDLNDLLTLLEKCTFFHKEDFNKPRIKKLKHFFNEVLHSESMKVMGQEMMEGLDRMIKFLEYHYFFNQVQSCKDAVEKIEQLRDNPMDDDLFAEYEKRARDFRDSVLADKLNRPEKDSDASHTSSKDLQDKKNKEIIPVVKLRDNPMDDDLFAEYEKRARDFRDSVLADKLNRPEKDSDASHTSSKDLQDKKNKEIIPVVKCEKTLVVCKTCGKAFVSPSSLSKHILREHKPKSNECVTCGKRFALIEDLSEHSISHNREIAHTCSVCGKNYKHRQSLSQHMTVHDTNRKGVAKPPEKQTCKKCGKMFMCLRQHNQICREGRERKHACKHVQSMDNTIEDDGYARYKPKTKHRKLYSEKVCQLISYREYPGLEPRDRQRMITRRLKEPDEDISKDYLSPMAMPYSGSSESDSDLVRTLDDLDTSPQHRKTYPSVSTSEKIPGIPPYHNPQRYQRSPKMSTMDTRNIKGEKMYYKELLSEIDKSTASFQDLLHEKKLPKNEELQKALALYRTGLLERVKFDSMCDIICSHIKAKSTYIRFVRPSYTSKDPEKVVFVVMCEKSINLQVDYNVKTHIIGSSSNEAKEIMYHKDEQFSLKESELLTFTIDKYAEELMRKHRNICMISSCLLKSIGHGTENARIIQKKCIVIYVDVKGFIPIHDEMLPVSLKVPNSDQVIPIDVRESGYQSFYGAQAYHQNLKPGCMIRGKTFGGTLGGFFEKNGRMYALTSAHTFLTDDSSFQTCLSSNKPYRYSTDLQQKVCVYQNEQNDEHIIGHIVYAAIDRGRDNRSGVDIAVIELTDTTRYPVSGQFPDCDTEHAGFTIDEPMEYSSGLTYDLKSFTEQAGKSSEAYKFGSTTDCTKGSFVVLGACVRTMEYYDNLTFGKPLYKQYEVKSLGNPDTNPFADHGDSGALVFAKHDGNRSDLRVVGMVQGGTYHKTCVVTPIWAIFHKLGNNGLRFKDFRFNRQNIFGPEMPMVSQDDYSDDVWIHNRDREQDIAQDLSRHVREIKQELTEKTDAQNNKLDQLTEKFIRLEEKTNEQTNGVMNKLDYLISLNSTNIEN